MKKDILPFYLPSDRVIAKAKDCYLFDSEGRKYIDFESGVGSRVYQYRAQQPANP